jgi:hypothetical protein
MVTRSLMAMTALTTLTYVCFSFYFSAGDDGGHEGHFEVGGTFDVP